MHSPQRSSWQMSHSYFSPTPGLSQQLCSDDIFFCVGVVDVFSSFQFQRFDFSSIHSFYPHLLDGTNLTQPHQPAVEIATVPTHSAQFYRAFSSVAFDYVVAEWTGSSVELFGADNLFCSSFLLLLWLFLLPCSFSLFLSPLSPTCRSQRTRVAHFFISNVTPPRSFCSSASSTWHSPSHSGSLTSFALSVLDVFETWKG